MRVLPMSVTHPLNLRFSSNRHPCLLLVPEAFLIFSIYFASEEVFRSFDSVYKFSIENWTTWLVSDRVSVTGPKGCLLLMPYNTAIGCFYFQALENKVKKKQWIDGEEPCQMDQLLKKNHFPGLLEQTISTLRPQIMTNGFEKCEPSHWDPKKLTDP